MSRRVDDLSQDPFAEENMPEQQSMQEDVMDVAMDKAKTAASNYVREAPKSWVRRAMWSFLLNFTFRSNDPLTRERDLNKLMRGEKMGLYEFFFGGKLTIFGIIRWIILLSVLFGGTYYLWSNGFLDTAMEQMQALEQIQGTATP